MNFAQEIKKLNPRQRQAVQAIEGPVMVVAGPGTGKTQILALRIANILQQTDTSPESILALTFTESAVASMKQRLLDIIGPAAYQVSVKTIHGFCNELIQEYPEAFPMIAGEANISEVEQIRTVRALLDSGRQRFARDVVSSISELKREGLTPKDVQENEELSRLYGAYQKELTRTGRYDYDDMVLSVAQVLAKSKDLRLTLREKYLYILVDEHQDTNQSQNQVIELLAGLPASGGDNNPNLFVVGDAKQAIYRFQGAQLENFSYFKKRFKKARVIALTDNYRSTQTILDNALVVANDTVRLMARSKHPERPIAVVACASSATEPYAVARHIKERIRRGARPEEIAIFFRTHKEATPIARYLEKLGVPVALRSDQDLLESPEAKKLVTLLIAVRDFGADYALIPALYLDTSKVAPLDVALLIQAARQLRSSVFSIVRDHKALQKIIPQSADAVFALYESLSLWKAMSKSFSLMPMFEAMVRETKLFTVGAALLGALKDAITHRRSTTLEDFVEHLVIMQAHRVGLKSHQTGDEGDGVQLMTAHSSKGLEFDYVYITGATENQWERRRSRNVFRFRKVEKDEAGERNLFYVALTRARKEVVISYGKANGEGKAQVPSRFIAALRPELVKELSLESFEKELAAHPEIEFRESLRPGREEQIFLRRRFLERGLSVSALNNYLECPNKFYFLNIVGIPEAPNAKAQAGTAAHGALKYAVSRRVRGESVSKKQFIDQFVRQLSREPMREIDFKQMLAAGEKVLDGYYDRFSRTWGKDMRPEFSVSGVKLGKVPLVGRLDRVDLLSNGRARVVDYKFKKPMSRNEIAGKTKSADGNGYRQLTFYKLLIDEGTKWKMEEGVLDFLEPDAKRRFKQEVFAPSDTEVTELKKVIQRVVKEVTKGEFKGCAEKDCKYCSLLLTMR